MVGQIAPNKHNKTVDTQAIINLLTGSLSLNALYQVLNILPFEVTFADENDFIAYYSDNPQRVNSRTVDLLGQPFLSLFNQDEQEAISQILRDLHQGAADHYEQWFPQNKQTIYNNFYAVRDEDGTFLGTLQFTGDITRIQGLRGIRTVFNAGKSDR